MLATSAETASLLSRQPPRRTRIAAPVASGRRPVRRRPPAPPDVVLRVAANTGRRPLSSGGVRRSKVADPMLRWTVRSAGSCRPRRASRPGGGPRVRRCAVRLAVARSLTGSRSEGATVECRPRPSGVEDLAAKGVLIQPVLGEGLDVLVSVFEPNGCASQERCCVHAQTISPACPQRLTSPSARASPPAADAPSIRTRSTLGSSWPSAHRCARRARRYPVGRHRRRFTNHILPGCWRVTWPRHRRRRARPASQGPFRHVEGGCPPWGFPPWTATRQQAVGVPHVPGAEVVPTPSCGWALRSEIQDAIRGVGIARHTPGITDRVVPVRNDSVAPAVDLVAEEPERPRSWNATGPEATEPADVWADPRWCHLDDEPVLHRSRSPTPRGTGPAAAGVRVAPRSLRTRGRSNAPLAGRRRHPTGSTTGGRRRSCVG